MNKWVYLLIGIICGGIGCWSWDNIKVRKLGDSEVALGEMCYNELRKYPSGWQVDDVTSVIKGLSSGSRTLQPQKERDEVLLELASRESEKIAQENLQKAETYLALLSQKDEISTVVDNKVFFTVLEAGSGESVSQNDRISIYFKQYTMEGEVIKDTKDQAFKVPLSRMIKGFKLALDGAKVGERRKLYIHPDYGFGKIGRSEELNQLLIYEVVINSVEKQS